MKFRLSLKAVAEVLIFRLAPVGAPSLTASPFFLVPVRHARVCPRQVRPRQLECGNVKLWFVPFRWIRGCYPDNRNRPES